MGPCACGSPVVEAVRGQVMALEANFCRVRLEQPGPAGQRLLLCTRRSRLAHGGQQVMVGDWVGLEGLDWTDGRAAVASLEPRRSELQRPALANADRVVVVVALAQPQLEPEGLSRFLICAETTGLEVLVLLSKADLVEPALGQRWIERLAAWGYGAQAIGRGDPLALGALRQRLQGGVSVLCGPSGVGKSSLLNALVPALALRTAAVSGKLQRGRHTTRHVELHDLAVDTLLADTPGFNRPELPTDARQWPQLFPEIRRQQQAGPRCRFRDCRHLQEPGCAIDRHWERYGYYRALFDQGP